VHDDAWHKSSAQFFHLEQNRRSFSDGLDAHPQKRFLSGNLNWHLWWRREFAARVGADAHKSQAELQAALQQKGQLVVANTKLSQVRFRSQSANAVDFQQIPFKGPTLAYRNVMVLHCCQCAKTWHKIPSVSQASSTFLSLSAAYLLLLALSSSV
jgi:hypothetical protein